MNADLCYASKKSVALCTFRKRKLLHALNKSKLCPHRSHAHLAIPSQICVRLSTNMCCNLETHPTICNTWPAPVHNVSITGMCRLHWLRGLNVCPPCSLFVAVPSELNTAHSLPLYNVKVFLSGRAEVVVSRSPAEI